jgi:stress-induced morphogen
MSVIVTTAAQYRHGRGTLFAMPTPEEIKRRIEDSIPGAHADVEDFTGGGDHFRATVICAAFAGKSRIEQHRLVYDVFDGEIGGPIHALSLTTRASDADGAAASGAAKSSVASVGGEHGA